MALAVWCFTFCVDICFLGGCPRRRRTMMHSGSRHWGVSTTASPQTCQSHQCQVIWWWGRAQGSWGLAKRPGKRMMNWRSGRSGHSAGPAICNQSLWCMFRHNVDFHGMHFPLQCECLVVDVLPGRKASEKLWWRDTHSLKRCSFARTMLCRCKWSEAPSPSHNQV